jgi:hypothetical protein
MTWITTSPFWNTQFQQVRPPTRTVVSSLPITRARRSRVRIRATSASRRLRAPRNRVSSAPSLQGEQVGEQPDQPLVADRVDEAQVQRHRQDRDPEGRAVLQSLGDRGQGDAAAAWTVAGEPLDPGHHRAHRRRVDPVVAAVQDLVGLAQPGAAVRPHAGLGDDGLVGLGAQRATTALAAHTAGPRPVRLPLSGRSALWSDDGGWLELPELLGGSPNFASSTAMRAC